MVSLKILALRTWDPDAKPGSIGNPLNRDQSIRKAKHFAEALADRGSDAVCYGLWKNQLYRAHPSGCIEVEGSHCFPFDLARNGFSFQEVGRLADATNQTLYCSTGRRGVVFQVAPRAYPIFVFSSDALFLHSLERDGYFRDELSAFINPLEDRWTRVNGTLYRLARNGEIEDCGDGTIVKPYIFNDIAIEATEKLLSWYCLNGQAPVYARTEYLMVSAIFVEGNDTPVIRRERYYGDLGLLS